MKEILSILIFCSGILFCACSQNPAQIKATLFSEHGTLQGVQISCAGHRSRQIRQPAAQTKLRELRQRTRYACFVPMMQKMQNNRDFTLSPKSTSVHEIVRSGGQDINNRNFPLSLDLRNRSQMLVLLLVLPKKSTCEFLRKCLIFSCSRKCRTIEPVE